jgi:choice-of-anchor A domain-containing protein
MRKATLRISMAVAAVLLTALMAQANALGTAGLYNEFIFGDIKQKGTDVEGRVAAGGSVYYTDMSVARKEEKVDNPKDYELVVRKDLHWTRGSVGYFPDENSGSPLYKKGDVIVGGKAYFGTDDKGYSTVTHGDLLTRVGSALPVDFAAERTYLESMASFWGHLGPTGVTDLRKDEIWLTGLNTDLNIFSLSAADIVKQIGFHIEAPYGSTILVNISGQTAGMEGFGFFFNPIGGQEIDANYDQDGLFPDSRILYNFYEATSLTIAGIGVQGSILAPWADTFFDDGHIDGNLIAKSLRGAGEGHNRLFDGNLPVQPVPEPATLVLLGSGLCGLAAWRRRKN